MPVIELYAKRGTWEDVRDDALHFHHIFFCHDERALLLGAYATSGGCCLELSSLRGLYIVPPTTEFLEDSGAEHLFFEGTEGAFYVVPFGQGDLSHD